MGCAVWRYMYSGIPSRINIEAISYIISGRESCLITAPNSQLMGNYKVIGIKFQICTLCERNCVF